MATKGRRARGRGKAKGGGNAPAEKKPDAPSSGKSKKRKYKDAKRLVDAIFEENDPVATATTLLGGKGGVTVAKIWALLLEYRYGKPVQQVEAAGPDGERFNFITLAPRPEREYENREGGEAG